MKTHTRPSSRGITLLEALIALLVISLGMLAIARFYGDIIASTGTSKARVEAMQLAETAIDSLRTQAIGQSECDAVGALGTFPDPPEPVPGVNAWFTPQTTVTQLTQAAFRVDVTVSWEDPKVTDTDLQPRVRLSSEIACDNPQTSVALVDSNSGPGGLQAGPTGKARLGGDNDYADGLPPDATTNTFPGDSDTDDGTLTFVTEGGARELIDAVSGKVLLTIDDGTAFSTIAGRVYVEGNSPSPEVVRMIISATGYCALNQPDPNSLPANATGNNIKYFFMEYQCYVGGDWYGNVGIYRTDGMGNNDRVCLGDPDELPADYTTSPHPQLSVSRTYRGFKRIGLDAQGDPTYTSVGIESGKPYEEHDFLLVRITGKATDSDCNAQLKLTPIPYELGYSEFVNNPGKMVCLTEQRTDTSDSSVPYACPAIWPTGSPPVTAQTIAISGTIDTDTTTSLVQDNPPVVFAGDADNVCDMLFLAGDDPVFMYTCEVASVGEGWSGSVWLDSTWLGDADVAGLLSTPSAYTLTNEFVEVTNLDFTLSTDSGPEVPTLTLSGTIKRSTTDVTINSVSVERGTCSTLTWDNGALSTTYSCVSGEWAPSQDWLVTLPLDNQSAICDFRTDPDVSTNGTATTVTIQNLQNPEIVLDLNTRRTAGGSPTSPARTCPVFDD